MSIFVTLVSSHICSICLYLKIEFRKHVLSVQVQLGCLAKLSGQRVNEFGYQTRTVVVGLAKMVGDHPKSERLDVFGNDGLGPVQRQSIHAVYRDSVGWKDIRHAGNSAKDIWV